MKDEEGGERNRKGTGRVGGRQGCVMSPWLFSIYMDGCIREMKIGVQELGARLNVRGVSAALSFMFYIICARSCVCVCVCVCQIFVDE